MENYLKISELAKLMEVSVHQLRYFEKKGVFSPAYIDNNGYRMYGINEIYQLSQILLLRSLQIPVQKIYEANNDYTPKQFELLLDGSLQKIQKQIEQLTLVKEKTQQILTNQQNLKDNMNNFQIQYFSKRYLHKKDILGESKDIDLNKLKRKSKEFSSFFSSDLIYLYGEKELAVYIESENKEVINLEEGEYLCRNFLVYEKEDIEKALYHLECYIEKSAFTHHNPVILIEKSYSSIFHAKALVYEIQIKVQLRDV